jgi:hypothetical protein
MGKIERTRVLRPSTRAADSPYKVDTSTVGASDMLRLAIRDEKATDSNLVVCEFRGRDIAGRDSIHFEAAPRGKSWRLTFSSAKPYIIELG